MGAGTSDVGRDTAGERGPGIRRSRPDDARSVDIWRHCTSDLAVACACAAGSESAWEYFMREQRPILYRSANAIDAAGGRDLADSLRGPLRPNRSRRRAGRCFDTSTVAAVWPRGSAPCSLITSINFTSAVVSSLCLMTSRREPSSLAPSRWIRATRYLARSSGRSLELCQPRLRDRLRLGCYYARE
jgi:hypothetical protein